MIDRGGRPFTIADLREFLTNCESLNLPEETRVKGAVRMNGCVRQLEADSADVQHSEAVQDDTLMAQHQIGWGLTVSTPEGYAAGATDLPIEKEEK